MKSVEVLELLTLSATDQWGIITTAQAAREGISRLQLRRLTEKGRITRIRQGVYTLPSAQHGPAFDIQAAWVSLDPKLYPEERWDQPGTIAVSHESAAAIHQIGNLVTSANTFSSSARKQTAHKDIKIYHPRKLPAEDVVDIDGLPVTSVERTVEDLAGQRIEFGHLADVVNDALQQDGVSFRSLAERLDMAAHFYGHATGQKLLEACEEVSQVADRRTAESLSWLSQRYPTQAKEALASLFGPSMNPACSALKANAAWAMAASNPLKETVARMLMGNPDMALPAGLNSQLNSSGLVSIAKSLPADQADRLRAATTSIGLDGLLADTPDPSTTKDRNSRPTVREDEAGAG